MQRVDSGVLEIVGVEGDFPRSDRDSEVSRQYYLLRDALVNGAISHDVLLLETEIARQRGVSRTPVREALARLEQDGFLERGVRGYRIRVVGPSTVVDLYETRLALEVAATGSAATRRTPLEFARIEFTFEQSMATDQPDQLELVRTKFHEAIWIASHNPTMVDIIQKVFLQLRVFNSAKSTEVHDFDRWRGEHGVILAAIREGDEDAAREAMRAHLQKSLAYSLEVLARSAP